MAERFIAKDDEPSCFTPFALYAVFSFVPQCLLIRARQDVRLFSFDFPALTYAARPACSSLFSFFSDPRCTQSHFMRSSILPADFAPAFSILTFWLMRSIAHPIRVSLHSIFIVQFQASFQVVNTAKEPTNSYIMGQSSMNRPSIIPGQTSPPWVLFHIFMILPLSKAC